MAINSSTVGAMAYTVRPPCEYLTAGTSTLHLSRYSYVTGRLPDLHSYQVSERDATSG
jgi:hypothetical protein